MPVQLDFSKAQPLAAPAASSEGAAPPAGAPGGPTPAPQTGVQLDFTHAQPVSGGEDDDDEQGALGHAWQGLKEEVRKPWGQQFVEGVQGGVGFVSGVVHSASETVEAIHRLMAPMGPLAGQAAQKGPMPVDAVRDAAAQGMQFSPKAASFGEFVEQLAEYASGERLVGAMAAKLLPEVRGATAAAKVGRTAAKVATAGATAGAIGGAQTAVHQQDATAGDVALSAGLTGVLGAGGEVVSQATQGIRQALISKFGLSGDLAAVADDSVARAEGARAATEQGVAASQARQATMEADLPHTVNRLVADTAMAIEQESARVARPFAEIGEAIQEPISNAVEVRAILANHAKDLGVLPGEIPRDALKALGSKGTAVSGAGEFLESDRLRFNDLTRLRSDLMGAAQKNKDGAIGNALTRTYDELTRMQQQAATARGLGEKYAAAKAEFAKYKRELGSGMASDFIAARDFAEQHYSGKLAQMTSRTNAERLRDLLRTAGIDASPLDRLLGDIKAERLHQAELLKTGKSTLKEIAGEKTVVPGTSNLDLKGMSTPELARLRLQTLAKTMQRSGIGSPWHMMMTLYGLYKVADGIADPNAERVLTGAAMAMYGAGRLEIPALVKSKTFQDWLLRDAGVDLSRRPLVGRLRTAIAAMGPQLAKRMAATP